MEKELKYIPKTTALRIKELFKNLSKDYVKLIYEKEREILLKILSQKQLEEYLKFDNDDW